MSDISSRKKIFVSAYACEPGLGSESGVGWHWVCQLALHFEVWVLTRQSNRPTIEAWIASHPDTPTIHFVYYDLPTWARRWKKGLRGVRIYYLLWQRGANALIRRVMKEHQITVYHHLTYGNALWSVSKWGRQQTFIWGPIGGLETIPSEFTRYYDWKDRLSAACRRGIAHSIAWNPGFIRRCHEAQLILCKTEATYRRIPLPDRAKACLMTDVATEKKSVPVRSRQPATSRPLRLLAAGRLDAWRGFDLLIEAMARLQRKGIPASLSILGEGSDKPRLIRWIKANQVERLVTLEGKVNTARYEQFMQEADIVINPSLKEAAVTVSLDALAYGKPLVALGTKGFTLHLPTNSAVVLPIQNREQVVADLEKSILTLSDDSLRSEMRERILEAAHSLSWKHKGEEIFTQFEKVYAH